MSKNKSNNSFAKSKTFKFSLVASAIMGISSPVFAEEAKAEESDTEVIVVTGIRGALITAAQTKRDSSTFVDSISASDANALPDLSVAEALSRLPGVTVSRYSGGTASNDFPSPEGSGNLIRGLSYVRSELNGRDAFTADGGRELDWASIPTTLVGGVDVYKNQSADLIEGGISGSINLRTLNPFDKEEGFAIVDINSTYADVREKWSPAASLVLGERWKFDSSEFGLIGSFATSDLNSGIEGYQAGAPTPYGLDDGSTIAMVPGWQLRTNEVDRERDSIYLAGQWKRDDDSLEVLVKYVNVQNEVSQFERTFESFPDAESASTYTITDLELAPFTSDGIALCNGSEEAAVGDCDATQAIDGGLMESGLITSNFRSWTGAQGNNARGLGKSQDNTAETEDISINVKWLPSDSWMLEFDAQRSTADSSHREQWIGTQTFLDVRHTPDLENPELEFTVNPNHLLNGVLPTGPSDPAGTFAMYGSDEFKDGEGELTAVKADATYYIDDNDWFESIKFGARYQEREQTNKEKAANWAGMNTPWSGAGMLGMDTNAGVYHDVVDFGGFFGGGVVKGDDTSIIFFGEDYIKNPNSFYDLLGTEPNYANVDYDPFTNSDGTVRRTADYKEVYNADDTSNILEETINLYAMVNFVHDFDNGMDISGNLGLRYVKNTLTTDGTLAYAPFSEDEANPITEFYPQEAEDNDHKRDFLPETADYLEQADQHVDSEVEEDFFLPSINIKLNLNEDMLIRFGASKAMTRPDVQDLRASQSINANTSRIEYDPLPDGHPDELILRGAEDITLQNINYNGGNPILNSTESVNLDLSFEWYFENGGYVSAGLFNKDLKNVIQDGRITLSQTTLDGQTVNVLYNGKVNVAEAELTGIELATQYFFTDDLSDLWANLGFQANYTYIDASQTAPESSADTSGDGEPDNQALRFGLDNLLGQSEHTANLIAIYQGDDFETRLAWNWRSEYLTSYRDFVPGNPVFQQGGGYVDWSAKYNITESLTTYISATNILDRKSKAYQQIDQSGQKYMRSSFINDRRIQVGVTYQF
jgi:iron complex outermembrane receptor protein